MASAGAVTVDFVAETAKFRSQIGQLESRLKKTESAFASLGSVARTGLAFLGGAAIGSFLKTQADAADQLGKTADKLGATTQALKSFQIAASEAGVDTAAANKLLTEGQKRLGEAAAGTGEAAKFIKLLGLNVQDLQQLKPDELFTTYADAINGLSNKSEQLAAANALMGRSAQEAFSLIQAGSPAIADAAQFTERFGLALDRVSIKQIEAANDIMGRLSLVSQAAAQRIAAGLAPAVEFFSNRILDATGNTEELQARTEQFSAIAITAFELASNGARSLQAAFFGVAAGIAKSLEVITSPSVIGALKKLPGPLQGIAIAFGSSTENLSQSFAASVDANLAKAEEALRGIKSIEQIQETVTSALEQSRQRAEAAVAAQAAADAARQSGGVSLAGDSVTVAAQEQQNLLLELSEATAQRQMEIEDGVTAHVQEQLSQRVFATNAANDAMVHREFLVQEQIQNLRETALNSALNGLQAFSGRSKKVAIALVAINKAMAISKAIQDGYVAVQNALAYVAYPANLAAAAQIKALTAINVAGIAASGFGQIQSINSSGGSGAPLGSSVNPVFTNNANSEEQFGATSQRGANRLRRPGIQQRSNAAVHR